MLTPHHNFAIFLRWTSRQVQWRDWKLEFFFSEICKLAIFVCSDSKVLEKGKWNFLTSFLFLFQMQSMQSLLKSGRRKVKLLTNVSTYHFISFFRFNLSLSLSHPPSLCIYIFTCLSAAGDWPIFVVFGSRWLLRVGVVDVAAAASRKKIQCP